MSRLRHKKPEKVCNKRKAEMKKSKKGKKIFVSNAYVKKSTTKLSQKQPK